MPPSQSDPHNRKRVHVEAGDKYGNWTVLRELARQGRNRRVLCRCVCGEETEVALALIRNGASQGCRNCSATRARQKRVTKKRGDGQATRLIDRYLIKEGYGGCRRVAHRADMAPHYLNDIRNGRIAVGVFCLKQLAVALQLTPPERAALHMAAALDAGYELDDFIYAPATRTH